MSITDIEKACIQICAGNIDMYVPWYLMAAYAYYVEDDPILTDGVFDTVSRRFLEKWDEINHRHKYFVTKEMLEAGTYIGNYPSRIKGAVQSVRETYR